MNGAIDSLCLYVSTDPSEAAALIGDSNGTLAYRHVDLECAKSLKALEGVSFLPMSCITFTKGVSMDYARSLIDTLAAEGLFVAADIGTSIREYRPRDMETRDRMLGMALRGDCPFPGAVLRYSNRPDLVELPEPVDIRAETGYLQPVGNTSLTIRPEEGLPSWFLGSGSE